MEVLRSECNGALFGAVSSPSTPTPGYSSPIVALRKKLDLYANLRPVRSVAPSAALQVRQLAASKGGSQAVNAGQNALTSRPVDLAIVRENTEDVYVKEERTFEDPNGRGTVAEATKRISAYASSRIARMAGDVALRRAAARVGAAMWAEASASGGGAIVNSPADDVMAALASRGPHVTIAHKSNVLPATDGLFRRVCREVLSGAPYTPPAAGDTALTPPRVEVSEQIIDSLFYLLYLHPEKYDVIVAPNLYGDLLSDAAAALVGSLGLVPSANVGDAFVVGEPCHGSAPDIEGKGIANPIAAIRSAALMLECLGEMEAAMQVEKAVDGWAAESDVRTPDLGGTSGTEDVLGDVLGRL